MHVQSRTRIFINFDLIKSYITPTSASRIIDWPTLLDFPLKL